MSESDSARAGDESLPRLSPDVVEEELRGEGIDNIVPTHGYQMTPMVGIGGSAGAIRPLQAFFESTPADSGMVFVVVLHLSPDHESMMAEMMQKWTRMPVTQASDGEQVKVNHVYVIPPGKHLTAANGHLRLTDLDHEQGRRVAVDLFFRSLADTHGPHAAAIVLSGADGDGTLGVKRIKERGGLTIAQDPEEAEHNAMPLTAIGTGMVDWVLKAHQMPQRILDYISRETKIELPPEDGAQPATLPRPQSTGPESTFREILVLLRMRTGRDFSYCKRATILRRISRRMQVNDVDGMAQYLAFLRTHPGESGALLKDLLISVTNFFRDRDAFAALEARIRDLFAGKTHGDTVRVWCPACATGEEAYSIAMMLAEHAATLDEPPAIHVFGSDLDDDAVQTARLGVFPEAIVADVSEQRLQRFFVKEHQGYRVRRELREVVLFASHDLLKDPPFSRIDLITCRNLLIYLNRDAQARALELFHFALKPAGLLFLGTSETADDGNALFRVLDKKQRIYARQASGRVSLPLPTGASTLVRQIEQQVAAQNAMSAPPSIVQPTPIVKRASAPRDQDRLSWSELHFKLIERVGPPSILVDRDHDIQHISESAGKFLQVTGGSPSTNLLRLVHSALRSELRALLLRAANIGATAEAFAVPIAIDGQQRAVDLAVHPANDLAPDFLLVTFTMREATRAHEERDLSTAQPRESIVQHLEREIEQMKEHLRDTVEQYEASTEELKASNEELQAMNEELRSATEELETSREELQSINEELTTVNQEARTKVEELGQANSDLANLMSATEIATLFLDRDLRVMRFTDSAAPIFNLIPGDIGRPLSDLQHHIDYPELADDAARVLERLTPTVREVKGVGDTCYQMRMLPYRSLDDRIAGVVLALVDVTEHERTRRELDEELASTERLRSVSEQFAGEDTMQALFEAMVDAAMSVTNADAGTVQMLDDGGNTLRLLAARSVSPELGERIAVIEVSGAPHDAWLTGKRAFVDFDKSMSQTAQADVGGLRCALRTPLMTRGGQPIGLISTYWKALHTLSDRELRFLDILARQAADAIERQVAADILSAQMEELTRFNDALVGRETRMIELKREVNELTARLSEKPRYPLDFEQDAG